MNLVTLHDEPRFVIARWEEVIVGLWWRDATVADIDRLSAEYRRAVADHNCIGTLTVLRTSLGLGVDDEIRLRSKQVTEEFVEQLYASAIVIEAAGLRATILRSAIIGISLVGRSKSPTKPFSSIEDACVWLGELHRASPRSVEEARAMAHAVTALADAR